MLTGRLADVRRHTFASLTVPNYRLFFGGVIFSTTGTWVQLIAESWLIIRLGGSGLALGVTTALQFIPVALLGSYAGVMVDRWNRRRLVLVAQGLAGVLAAVVALLTATGEIRIWMVWVAAMLVGCIDAFHSPARGAFSAELVGPDLVGNAIALTTAVTVSARAIGPAAGGLLVAGIGIAPCFLINAASYGVGVISVAAMNPKRLHVEVPEPRARGQVVAGVRYVWQHVALRRVLVMVGIVGIVGSNVPLLLTLLARSSGHGPMLYGGMMSCLGGGMVIGSLLAAGWHSPTGRGVGLLALAMGFAFLLIAFAQSLTPSLVAIGVLGVASGMFLASASGSLQLKTAPGMRGRVMAMYTIAALGTAAAGGPIIGWIAATWSVQIGLLVSGLCCQAACVAGVLVARHRTTELPIPSPRLAEP